MVDPIILCNGITYERAYIIDWLSKINNINLYTGIEFKIVDLVSNLDLKSAIEQYKR